MPSENKSEKNKISGLVEDKLPNATFRVRLEDERVIIAYLAGKMKIHRIRVLPGDRVTVELGEYDVDRGRIVRRL